MSRMFLVHCGDAFAEASRSRSARCLRLDSPSLCGRRPSLPRTCVRPGRALAAEVLSARFCPAYGSNLARQWRMEADDEPPRSWSVFFGEDPPGGVAAELVRGRDGQLVRGSVVKRVCPCGW